MAGPITVLHVDDEPGFAEMVAAHLERVDDRLTVRTAADVAEARARLDEAPVDCVVSDYDMPGPDGLELLSAVRERQPELPFVLFTGKGSEEIASEAISAGVTDYIQKEGGTEQYEVLANRVVQAVSRHRAERALREREERFRELVEAAPVPIVIYDADRAVRFANDAAVAFTRAGSRADLVGRSVPEFVAPEDRGRARRRIERVLGEREPTEPGELTVVDLEGERRKIVLAGAPVEFEGEPCGQIVINDVTDRHRREEALRTQKARIEHLHDVAMELKTADSHGEVYRRSVDASADVLGFGTCVVLLRDDDVLRRVACTPDLTDVLPETVGLEEGLAGRTYREGSSVLLEDVADDPDATNRGYTSVVSVPLGDRGVFQVAAREPGAFDEHDRRLAELLVAHAEEAAGRLESEGRLRAERDQFAALFRNVDEPVVKYRYDDEVPYVESVNPAFEDTFGWSDEAVVGEPLDEFVVPPDGDETARALNERVMAGDRLDVEVRRVTADGPRDFLLRSAPINPGDPDGVRGYAIYTDITERRRMERELEARERKFRSIAETSYDVIFRFDDEGRFTYLSPSIERISGYEAEQLRGEHFGALLAESSLEDAMAAFEATMDGDAVQDVGLAMVRADGVRREVSVNGVPIMEDGEFRGGQGVARDVTERRRRERELERQNERLDRFASVVSHDLRNPITVAKGNLELAREDHDAEELARVEAALDRMDDLTDDLLRMARQGRTVEATERVELAPLCGACWGLVQTADATLDVEDDLAIEADRGRLRQLVENLFRNAVAHGGPAVTVRVGGTDGGFYVEDDGAGIPEAERAHVLKPGYTTGEGGTGFGLNIVEEIAAAHGWSIAVREGADGGARFEFTDVDVLATAD